MNKTLDTNHWCRIVMDERTRQLIASLQYRNFDTLEISGERWCSVEFKTYTKVSFPDYDICSVPKEIATKDLIIAEQVFEHVEDPELGIKHIHQLLRPNGYLLITTPMLIRYHPCPNDYWRWTKFGLNLFLIKYGFTPIEVNSWGNYICLVSNLINWESFDPTKHPLNNEAAFPVVCWALAQKVTEK